MTETQMGLMNTKHNRSFGQAKGPIIHGSEASIWLSRGHVGCKDGVTVHTLALIVRKLATS